VFQTFVREGNILCPSLGICWRFDVRFALFGVAPALKACPNCFSCVLNIHDKILSGKPALVATVAAVFRGLQKINRIIGDRVSVQPEHAQVSGVP
jgi:hypothetical protein